MKNEPTRLPPMGAPVEDISTLRTRLARNSGQVTTVKPRVFFKKVEDMYGGPVELNQYIPSSGLGSLTMLEASIIAAIVKITKPKVLFEFGTFLGYSTSLLLRNAEADSRVYSIDLGASGLNLDSAAGYSDKELHEDDKKNDDYLRYTQARTGRYYLSHLSQEQLGRLTLLTGDSRSFDIDSQRLRGAIDLVFVDGGHTAEIVASDSHKAYEMVGENGVILWHDYNSTIHHDVSDFVGTLAKMQRILHVQHTMLALCFLGTAVDAFIG
jgi:hypothetical protein